ncbi:MAG: DNRLRE domain-containing protein, partial [Candidatus Hadarchaeales archaeon]
YGFNLTLSNPQGYVTLKSLSGTVSGPNSSFSISANVKAGGSGTIGVSGTKTLSELLSGFGGGSSGSGTGPNVTAQLKVEGGRLVLYLSIDTWTLNPTSGLTVSMQVPTLKVVLNSVNLSLGSGQVSVSANVGFNASDIGVSVNYSGSTSILNKEFTIDVPAFVVPLEFAGIPVEITVYASIRISQPTISIQLGPDLTQQQLSGSVSFSFIGATPGIGVSVVGYQVFSAAGGIGLGFSNPSFAVGHNTSGWFVTVGTGQLVFTTVSIKIKVLGVEVGTINVPQWSYTLWGGTSKTWNLGTGFTPSLTNVTGQFSKFAEGVGEGLYRWVNDCIKNLSGWANSVGQAIRQMVAQGLYNVSQAINNGWISLQEALNNAWISVWDAIRFHNHEVTYVAPAWTMSYPNGWTYTELDPSRTLKAPAGDYNGDGKCFYVYAEPAYLSTDTHEAYWERDLPDGPVPAGIKMAFNALYTYYGDGEVDEEVIRIQVLEGGTWRTVAERAVSGSHAVSVGQWSSSGIAAQWVTTAPTTKVRIYMKVSDYEGALGGEECGIALDAFQIKFSRPGEFKTTTLSATAAAAVSQLNPNTNYSGKMRVETYDWLLTRSDWRTYVKFSLSSLPSDAIITKAVLRMYCTQADGGWPSGTITVVCHYVTNDSWSSSGITWNNQPMSTSPNPTSLIADTVAIGGGSEPHSVNSWISWNVLGPAIDAFNTDKVVSFMLRDTDEAQWCYGIWAEFSSAQLYLEYFDP